MIVTIGDAYSEIGIRAGWLLGRYLDDYDLIATVATEATLHWVALGGPSGSPTVEQCWERYVDMVESAVGGSMCATDDDLGRIWLAHARRAGSTDVTVQAPAAPYTRCAPSRPTAAGSGRPAVRRGPATPAERALRRWGIRPASGRRPDIHAGPERSGAVVAPADSLPDTG